MYRQMAYPEKSDELRHVIPAREYIRHKVSKNASPFLPFSIWDRLFQNSARICLSVAEKVLGQTMYVANEHRELILLEPRTRALLTRLTKEGLIRSWTQMPLSPDIPPMVGVMMDIMPITLPDGRVRHMGGSTGNGVGDTLHEAMLPALGELLERYAITRWNEQRFVRGTYTELSQRGAVNPQNFVQYSKKQLTDPQFHRSIVTENTEMNWVPAHSLLDKKEVLIPAQLAYIMYEHAFPHEPVFQTTSSSGAAAGGSLAHAAYGAICEMIERDNFLMFWLNRIAPPRIDVKTIPDAEARELIERIRALDIRFEILDCTTDINVPTLVSVCIDTRAGHPVSISASTDLDPMVSVKKLAHELLMYLHSNWPSAKQTIDPSAIKNINGRREYWARTEAVEGAVFLLEGEEREFGSILRPSAPKKMSERLKVLSDILKRADYHCYLVHMKAREAEKAGLRVVRAVIPGLIPMYFNENRRHLGVERLYTTPAKLGYISGAKSEDELNTTPHPFL